MAPQSQLLSDEWLKEDMDEYIDGLIDSIPLGKLGFYTDDPDVFEARIAEIEADMDEVEAGLKILKNGFPLNKWMKNFERSSHG